MTWKGYSATELRSWYEDKMEHIPASASWRMRKQATIDQLESTDRDEQIIVLADKLSNMRTLYKDYREIGDEVWQRFNQKDKSEHVWYYRSIGEKLDKLKDTVPHHEYMDLVDRVFGSLETALFLTTPDSIKVKDGETYTIRMFAHNNKPKGHNAVARDVKARFCLPEGYSKEQSVFALIVE